MKCQVCGKSFKIGNNPITGVPNGVGLQFEDTGDKVFNVCSFCISYKKRAVAEKAAEWIASNSES